jgi:hypothetical protein
VALAAISAGALAVVVFVGTLEARRGGTLMVVALTKVVAAAVVVAELTSASGWRFGLADSALGLVGGVVGALGLVAVLRACAAGEPGRVANMAALSALLVPVLAGLLFGIGTTSVVLTSLLLALGALSLAGTRDGLEPEPVPREVNDRRGLVAGPIGDITTVPGVAPGFQLAVLGGFGFGAGLAALLATYRESGATPVLVHTVAGAVVLIGVLAVTGAGRQWPPGRPVAIAVIGVAEALAAITMLQAVEARESTLVFAVLACWPLGVTLLDIVVLRNGVRLRMIGVVLASSVALAALSWVIADRGVGRGEERSVVCIDMAAAGVAAQIPCSGEAVPT